MKNFILISLTFFLALSLSIIPMPLDMLWLRPAWVALTLIYWVIMMPNQINVGIAWMLGLLMDLLNGTFLGEYALVLALMAFFTVKLQRQLRLFPLLQQMMWLFLFILVYQFLLFIIQGISGQLILNWQFWLVPVSSMLLWPILKPLLQNYQQRFTIYTHSS